MGWRKVDLSDIPKDQARRFYRRALVIEVFARDERGRFYIDPVHKDTVARQRAYGLGGIYWTKD